MAKFQKLDRYIIYGFVLAGAINVIGMLITSRLFTNSYLAATDPVTFSWFGQLAIILWGLAYWSVAINYRSVPYLILVFMVEKLVYTVTWASWLLNKVEILKSLSLDSPSTAMFFRTYGINDFLFALFFGWVAYLSFTQRIEKTTSTF